MIDNHLLVGITRAANTMMMVGAMTFGIAFAMRVLVMNDIEIDHKFSELSMVPHDPYYIYAIAAAIAAMGFSMIFNIQRRLLWVVALGGIIAVCTRNFVNFELGYGPVIGSFMGSFVVSLIPNIFARRYIAKDRQRYLEEELEKRRQRGKFIEW